MEVALFPGECSEALASAVVLAGLTVSPLAELNVEGPVEWPLIIVELGEEPMRRLRLIERLAEMSGVPVLLAADVTQLSLLESASGFADLLVLPAEPAELRLRVRRLTRNSGGSEVLRFKDLELNPLTYQAALGGVPLDLTFMEYELLRYFVENQGRVWSREQLLSKVWGYDYYGGARTVDVHVRRLRAKLGEERSSWITTVRSVGYRFG
jgi:DNA-binding response OmpR family regulator